MNKYIYSVCLFTVSATSNILAVVNTFSLESVWLSSVQNVESLPFTSANLATADEVSSAPSSNTALGNLLTFDPINTGLATGFTLSADQIDADLIFQESNLGWSQPNILSIGSYLSHDDDDFTVTLFGRTTYAISFNFHDSTEEAGETLSIFNGVTLIDTITTGFNTAADSKTFLGIVSSTPFDRIVFNENSGGGDDIGIGDFQFAQVPEASHYCLLLSTVVVLALISRKRRSC